jgi:magnesium-transporting ATPase (P-type)
MRAAATTRPEGLTAGEVAERVARGQVNAVEERTSRPLREIVRANVFTRFNAILGVLGAIVLAIGAWGDSLFLGIVVVNALIGIGQEVRAKQVLDRLAVLNAPQARAVRDGEVVDLAVGDVVLDDLLELRAGDQVPADGRSPPVSRSTSRCSPANPTRSRRTLGTRSCPARSSSPVPAASRRPPSEPTHTPASSPPR